MTLFHGNETKIDEEEDKDIIIAISQVTDADVSLVVKDTEIEGKKGRVVKKRFKRTERRVGRTEKRGSRKVVENK